MYQQNEIIIQKTRKMKNKLIRDILVKKFKLDIDKQVEKLETELGNIDNDFSKRSSLIFKELEELEELKDRLC